MRIGIQTWGSTGDVRPFVALAAGLQAAGHEVHLVVTDIDARDYHGYAREYGFRLTQVATPVIADVQRLHEVGLRCLEGHPLRQGRIILNELFLPVLDQMHQASRELCTDSDLTIGHFFLYPLQAEAELQKKPYATVALAPVLIPTRRVPPSGTPHLGIWGNQFFWWLVRKICNRVFLPDTNALRESLGLAAKRDSFHEVFVGGQLDLVASSPALFPRPDDWAASTHLTGFFDLPEGPTADKVDEEMERFLAAGEAPVFITLGSLTPANSEYFLQNLALFDEALQRTKSRAIVQLPAHQIAGLPQVPHLHFTSYVSHRRVFPHCKLVVHHGGAGTTHTVARAGVPGIVLAHAADQFFWGEQCHRAGISPPMLKMKDLNAIKLARTIAAAASEDMRARAAQLGREMAQENGVAEAVRLVSEKFD